MSWQRKRPPGTPLDSGEISAGPDERYPRKSAYNKTMDFLARRALTELELRQKLAAFSYADDDIEDAVTRAKESKWLAPPEAMAEKLAEELGRKKKGHRFINQALRQKGLPPVTEDTEAEFEKARAVLESRLKHDFAEGPLPRELYEKAQRLLYTRGFSGDVIRRALAR